MFWQNMRRIAKDLGENLGDDELQVGIPRQVLLLRCMLIVRRQ